MSERLVTSLLEAFIEQSSQEDNLLKKYEKIFKSDKDEYLDRFKLIVFDMHADIEAGLNLAIMGKFDINTDRQRNLFETKVLDKINFMLKARMLKDLDFLNSQIFKKIENINNLRNKCAHPLSKKLMYNDKEIKQDKRIIKEIMSNEVTPIYAHFKKTIFKKLLINQSSEISPKADR